MRLAGALLAACLVGSWYPAYADPGNRPELTLASSGGMSGSASAGGMSTSIQVRPGGNLEGRTTSVGTSAAVTAGGGKVDSRTGVNSKKRAGTARATSSVDAGCPGGVKRHRTERSRNGRSSSTSVSCDYRNGASKRHSAAATSTSGGNARSSVSTGSTSSASSSSSSSGVSSSATSRSR